MEIIGGKPLEDNQIQQHKKYGHADSQMRQESLFSCYTCENHYQYLIFTSYVIVAIIRTSSIRPNQIHNGSRQRRREYDATYTDCDRITGYRGLDTARHEKI